MKKYTLIIEYDDKTEEVEFLSEEVVVSNEPMDLGTVDISEYYDKEILEFIDECYIIGRA